MERVLSLAVLPFVCSAGSETASLRYNFNEAWLNEIVAGIAVFLLAAGMYNFFWSRTRSPGPRKAKATKRKATKVEARAEACLSPEGLTDTPATASTSASYPAVLRGISQGSYDMSEIAEEQHEKHELSMSWHLSSRSNVPGVLGFAAGHSVFMGYVQAKDNQDEQQELPFSRLLLNRAQVPGVLGFAPALCSLKAADNTDGEREPGLPLCCELLSRVKNPGLLGLVAEHLSLPGKQVDTTQKQNLTKQRPKARKSGDCETSKATGDEPGESVRQLSDMLQDQQVCKLLRRVQQKLRTSEACVNQPSALRLLRILAQLQALWKVRNQWAEKPDDTWGVFLQRICIIMAPPPHMLQPVAILPKDDWRCLRRWCLDTPPQNIERIVEACLHFYGKPGRRTAERLSKLLTQERCERSM